MNTPISPPVFVGGLRTPFGRAGKGAYREIRPDDLLVELFRGQASRHPQLWQQGPQDLVVGCAYPEGEQGYNLGRMVALGAGLDVPGMTVNRLCASSLEAVAIAAARVRLDVYLLGTLLGMAPRTAVYIGFAAAARESGAEDIQSFVEGGPGWIVLVAGIVLMVGVFGILSSWANSVLARYGEEFTEDVE